MFYILTGQPPREKYISTYKQIRELHKKEGAIFEESFRILEAGQREAIGDISGMDWTLYNFQILIEMLDRFHVRLNISPDNRELILQSFDDLNLSLKMLCSGYYTSAGTHLRGFYEKNINWLHNHLTGKDEKNCRIKVDKIFKYGQVSYVNEPDLLPQYPINEYVVYKIYRYLSERYVHKGINDLDLKFVRSDFIEGAILTDICIHTIARIINIAIGDDIAKGPASEKILFQVDDYPCYYSYIQRLFGLGITVLPETLFFNYIHDSEIAKELILGKMELKLDDLCSISYLESHRGFIKQS